MANLLGNIGSGLKKFGRVIGDVLTPEEELAIIQEREAMPSATDETDAEYGMAPVPPTFQPRRQPNRLRSAIFAGLQGAVDAASTPNIAYGGGTDIMRAASNASEMARQRQMQNEQRQAQAEARSMAKQRLDADMSLNPMRKREIEAQTRAHESTVDYNKTRAQLAQDEAAKPPTRYINSSQGVFDVEAGAYVGKDEKVIQVKADVLRQLGQAVEDGTEVVPVPESMYMKLAPEIAKLQRPNTTEAKIRGEVAGIKAALISQGTPEDQADDAAWQQWMTKNQTLPTQRTQAQIAGTQASTANTGVRTVATQDETGRKRRDEEVSRLADKVIADDTSKNPDNAIRNVLDPNNYASVPADVKASVAAEIKRRQQAVRGGKAASGKLFNGAIDSALADAPPAPAANPQAPAAPKVSGPPSAVVAKMRPGQIVDGPDGSSWQKQPDGTVKRIK